jgi:Nuclease-related domain
MTSMRSSVEIFWSDEPENQFEKRFLAQLKADLEARKISTTILANFSTKTTARQIDFFVFTADHARHVELKNLVEPLVGERNGPWSSQQPDGSWRLIERQQNPYEQTVSGRFAISDDMHAFANASGSPKPPGTKRFFTTFDSVLCIYPALADGSRVPSDYKVQPLGYADFLDSMLTPGPHPPWDAAQRADFILWLGLVPARPSPAANRTLDAVHAQVREYRRRFRDTHGHGLHELVPTSLTMDDDRLTAADVPNVLKAERHIQIVGPSGSGKSHLATHTVLSMCDAGSLPIIVPAGLYNGRLSPLLDRSVAAHTTTTAAELLNAAGITNTPVVVVVDGFNECPARFQQQMLLDLAAFCLRFPTTTIMTSQISVATAAAMTARAVYVAALSEDERQAVLTSYGAPDVLDLCEPFSTAYELTLAAECAAELDMPTTRANLFDAFVRRRLAQTTSPAAARDALRRIALLMDERLVTSLPLDEVWRVVEQRVTGRSAPIAVVDDILACTITATRQGRFAFTHELLGRFLAADGLVLEHPDPANLAYELRKARHHDLKPLTIPLVRTADHLSLTLAKLSDWALLANSLHGSLGLGAQQMVEADAKAALRAATEGMEDTQIAFEGNSLHVVGGHALDSYEHALMSAVGESLSEGKFIDDVMLLLKETDKACHRSAKTQVAAGKKVTHTQIVSDVCVLGINRTQVLAAPAILESFRMTRHDSRFRSRRRKAFNGRQLEALLEGVSAYSYTVLYFLCELARRDSTPDAARVVPRLIQFCWDSGAYHLRLEALDTARSYCMIAEGDVRNEIVRVLEGFSPQNAMLSSLYVEVLDSYGLIESPTNAERVSEEIRELLGGPQNIEAFQQAHSIVTNMFEEIFSQAHIAAIEALERSDYVALLIMAAKARRSDFFDDWILRKLVKLGDRKALPVFMQRAANLDTFSPFPQGEIACHLAAVEGCSGFLGGPPQFPEGASQDLEAWRCWDEIVFWLYRPAHTNAEMRAKCAALWQRLRTDLVLAAADPLYQISRATVITASDGDDDPHHILLRTFPDEIRLVLEAALLQYAHLTSALRYNPIEERTQYIINILGGVGNRGTVELLSPFTEDAAHGMMAIASIRLLNERVNL